MVPLQAFLRECEGTDSVVIIEPSNIVFLETKIF